MCHSQRRRRNPDAYANGHSDSYAYANGDADTNKPAQINPDTEATSYSAASSVEVSRKVLMWELASSRCARFRLVLALLEPTLFIISRPAFARWAGVDSV